MSQPKGETSGGLPLPCPQPQTPHLEEDLKEVLRSEAGIELIVEDEGRPEKQTRKPSVSDGPWRMKHWGRDMPHQWN